MNFSSNSSNNTMIEVETNHIRLHYLMKSYFSCPPLLFFVMTEGKYLKAFFPLKYSSLHSHCLDLIKSIVYLFYKYQSIN